MAKKFISFLGTGKYKKCSYQLKAVGVFENVYFVQEALLNLCCNDFNVEDSLCFLLTQEAKQTHWNTSDGDKICLEKIVNDFSKTSPQHPKINPVDIPSGKNENEIWEIFDQVYNLLDENDEVIFDITHGFRSLPMLFFAVLNYATHLKKIQVKSIYYGAWEARDENTNIAPIFDLTPFYDLIQWGNAADAFVNYGNTDKVSNLISATAAEHKGSKKAGNSLHYTFNDLKTVRGKEITEGKIFTQCSKTIKGLSEQPNYSAHPAFKPFFSQISDVFTEFKINEPLNFLSAVKLHLEHGREQQAITLLQEGLLTLLLNINDDDWQDRETREEYSRFINSKIKDNITKNNKDNTVYTETTKLNRLEKNELFKEIISTGIYDKLTTLRNDINHGGYNKQTTNSSAIISNAYKYYSEVRELCQKYFAF